MDQDNNADTVNDTTLTDAISELQKVVSHNAQVTMKQYESLLNGIRLNNLLINAIIRKVGLSADEVKDECDKLSLELEEEAKKAQEALNEEQSSDKESETLSMEGGEGDHPEEAVIFGD